MSERDNNKEKDLQELLVKAITGTFFSLVGAVASFAVAVDARSQARALHPDWTSEQIDADYYAHMFEHGPYLAATIAKTTTGLSVLLALLYLAPLISRALRR